MSFESFRPESENIDDYSYNLESISEETLNELTSLDNEIFSDKVFSIDEVHTILQNMSESEQAPLFARGHMLSLEIGLEFVDRFIPNLDCDPGEITGSFSGSNIEQSLQSFCEWYNREYSQLAPITPTFNIEFIRALNLVVTDTLSYTGSGFESRMQQESPGLDLESKDKWRPTLLATDVNNVSFVAYTQGSMVIYKNLYNPVIYNRNGQRIGFESGGIYHFHVPSGGWPKKNYTVEGPITNQFEGHKRIARLSTFNSPQLGDSPQAHSQRETPREEVSSESQNAPQVVENQPQRAIESTVDRPENHNHTDEQITTQADNQESLSPSARLFMDDLSVLVENPFMEQGRDGRNKLLFYNGQISVVHKPYGLGIRYQPLDHNGMLAYSLCGVISDVLRIPKVFDVYLTSEEMQNPVVKFLLKYQIIRLLPSPPPNYELGQSIYGMQEHAEQQEPLHQVSESEFKAERHAWQGHSVISKPGEPVMSCGAGPCVIFTMYNPKNKMGSISHIDPNSPLSKKEIENLVSELKIESIDDLQVTMFGGWNSYSERIIYFIRNFFDERGVDIHKEDVLGGGSRSIFLDTNTGEHKYIDLPHFQENYLKRLMKANNDRISKK